MIRTCDHGVALGAPCDDPGCYNRSNHRCTTSPCTKVGCPNSRPTPPDPYEAFQLGLRSAGEAERESPNPADFPPEAVTVWEETQRLASRESCSSAMPGSLLGRDEDGRVGYETEPWNHRQPQAHPDLHHDQPIVFGTGGGAKVMWQQATPMHTGGARYRAKTPHSRVKRLTEREAYEINKQLDRAGVTDTTQQVLSLDAQGYSNREIADQLGLTVDGVKSRLKKAKQRLQKVAG